jgi:gliding motility-associated-like protein
MRKLFALLLLFFFSWNSFSQVIINNTTYVNPSPQQSLVQNVLLGNGVSASNFVYQGDPAALGFFRGLGTNLGLDSGVVMSSGNILDIAAPSGGFASTDHLSATPNDPDITSILNGGVSNDVAILEFDFVPQGDTVKFDYVFASEEYPEFVCSFNDVFGFFLSGPGINGPYANNAVNIALVPGTATPVSIDNVNNGLNNDPNDPTCPANNPQYYVINNGNDFAFDGFTTVLQAISAVQCGQTYHVKLVIADAVDDSYDSGVFLKARSFVSSAVLINSATLSGDTTIVEGCAQAAFQFTRPANQSNDTLVVNFNILGTATNGVDYSAIADSVVFLPGQSTVNVNIEPLNDGITEPTESIIIELVQNICGIFTQQSALYIVTPTPLSIVLQDTSLVCPNDSITLSPLIQGGYPPYFFTWSNGDTTGSITVSPDSTMSYYLVVSDTCGPFSSSDTLSVTVPQFTPASYNVTGGTISCPNVVLTLNASVSGGFPPYGFTWYEIDPNFPFPFAISFDSTAFVMPNVTTQYFVEITDACNLLVPYTDTVTVEVNYIPQVTLTAFAPAANGYMVEGCATGGFNFSYNQIGSGNDSITISYTISGSAANGGDYTLIPDSVIIPAGQNSADISLSALTDGLNEGVETLIITFDQNACNYPVQTDTIFIDNHQPIQITNSDVTLVCPLDTVILSAAFTGGYPPYTYSWSTGSTADSILVNPALTTSYTLTVSDTCGPSSDTQTITVNVPVFSPLTVQASDAIIGCPGSSDTVIAVVSGGFSPYSYVWTLNANFIGNNPTQIITPSAGSVYVITVQDACNTSPASDTVNVIQIPYQIPVATGSNVTVKCPKDLADLIAGVDFGFPPYNFSWSNGQGGVNDSIIEVSGPQSQSFSVTITDACGNTSAPFNIDYIVPVYPPLDVTSRTDTTVCPGSELTLPVNVSGGSGTYDFEWVSRADFITEGNNGEGTVTVNSSGEYFILVYDECFNLDIDSISVEMLPGCEVEEINVFTPNGDGKNETLKFTNLEYFPNSKLVVFNRWGEKVFESANYQNDWNGGDLHAGTYYYTLEIPESETKTGFFKLLR